MNVAEMKRAAESLADDERLELVAYLRHLAKQDDPEWQAEIGRRLDHCLAGQGRPAEELLAIHDRLTGQGR